MNPRDIRSLDVGMLRTFDALMRERSVSRPTTQRRSAENTATSATAPTASRRGAPPSPRAA